MSQSLSRTPNHFLKDILSRIVIGVFNDQQIVEPLYVQLSFYSKNNRTTQKFLFFFFLESFLILRYLFYFIFEQILLGPGIYFSTFLWAFAFFLSKDLWL